MARVSLMIAFSVLAVVAARAYPSSQEDSNEANDNLDDASMVNASLDNTSLEKPDLVAIDEGMIFLCNLNGTVEDDSELGHNKTYKNLIESVMPAITCVSNSIPLNNFVTELEQVTNETRSDFFLRYCPQLRTAGPCAQRVVKAVQPCLKEEDFTIISALANVLPEAIELFCKNDGEEFFKDYNPQYKECLKGNNSICNEGLHGRRLYPSNFTQDQCGAIKYSTECLRYKANMCGAPSFSSVYDLFHNTLFRVTSCSNYAAPSKVTEIDNNTISDA